MTQFIKVTIMSFIAYSLHATTVVKNSGQFRNALNDVNETEIIIENDFTIVGFALRVKGNKTIHWKKNVTITYTKTNGSFFRLDNVTNLTFEPSKETPRARLNLKVDPFIPGTEIASSMIRHDAGSPQQYRFKNVNFVNGGTIFNFFSENTDLTNFDFSVLNCRFWLFSHKAIFISRKGQKFTEIKKLTFRNNVFRARITPGFKRIRAISPDFGNDHIDCINTSTNKFRCTELEESQGTLNLVKIKTCIIKKNRFFNCGVGGAHLEGITYEDNDFQLDNDIAASKIDNLGDNQVFKIIDFENGAKNVSVINNRFHLKDGAGGSIDGKGPELGLIFNGAGSEWIDNKKDCEDLVTNFKFNDNTITSDGPIWEYLLRGYGFFDSEIKNNKLPEKERFNTTDPIKLIETNPQDRNVICASKFELKDNTYKNSTDRLHSEAVVELGNATTTASKSLTLNNTAENTFKIYPNPATNYVTISTKDQISSYNITLYTIEGEILKSLNAKNNSNPIELSLSGIPSGLYIISLHTLDNNFIDSEELIIK